MRRGPRLEQSEGVGRPGPLLSRLVRTVLATLFGASICFVGASRPLSCGDTRRLSSRGSLTPPTPCPARPAAFGCGPCGLCGRRFEVEGGDSHVGRVILVPHPISLSVS